MLGAETTQPIVRVVLRISQLPLCLRGDEKPPRYLLVTPPMMLVERTKDETRRLAPGAMVQIVLAETARHHKHLHAKQQPTD